MEWLEAALRRTKPRLILCPNGKTFLLLHGKGMEAQIVRDRFMEVIGEPELCGHTEGGSLFALWPHQNMQGLSDVALEQTLLARYDIPWPKNKEIMRKPM